MKVRSIDLRRQEKILEIMGEEMERMRNKVRLLKVALAEKKLKSDESDSPRKRHRSIVDEWDSGLGTKRFHIPKKGSFEHKLGFGEKSDQSFDLNVGDYVIMLVRYDGLYHRRGIVKETEIVKRDERYVMDYVIQILGVKGENERIVLARDEVVWTGAWSNKYGEVIVTTKKRKRDGK